jgi:metal-responsive CopG/Arc/MetJ family transcriptional regulator
MKSAISIPDELFHRAEDAARRLHVSRNELYSRAIAEFLNSRQDKAITDRLNEVYSQQTAKVDSGLHRAQLRNN